jgi:hypothetical protein
MEVNKQLDKMGYNIGLRLIEDFLAKTNTGRCANFRETAETISKVRIPPNPDCVTAGCYIPEPDRSPPGATRLIISERKEDGCQLMTPYQNTADVTRPVRSDLRCS